MRRYPIVSPLWLLLLLAGSGGDAAPPALTHHACLTDAQCLNGGTCVVVTGAHMVQEADNEYNHCVCPTSYGGLRCDLFCPLQCQNGGICYSTKGETEHNSNNKNSDTTTETALKTDPAHPVSAAYACKCLGHWTGTVCSERYRNCGNGVQCFNGGTCASNNEQNDSNNHHCDCVAGYGGPTCLLTGEVETDEPEGFLEYLTVVFQSAIGNVLLVLALMIALSGLAVYVFQKLKRNRTNKKNYKAVTRDDNGSEDPLQYEFSNSIQTQAERWRNIV